MRLPRCLSVWKWSMKSCNLFAFGVESNSRTITRPHLSSSERYLGSEPRDHERRPRWGIKRWWWCDAHDQCVCRYSFPYATTRQHLLRYIDRPQETSATLHDAIQSRLLCLDSSESPTIIITVNPPVAICLASMAGTTYVTTFCGTKFLILTLKPTLQGSLWCLGLVKCMCGWPRVGNTNDHYVSRSGTKIE